MTKEELKEYLKENLKIEFYNRTNGYETYLSVKITLEGEEISHSDSLVRSI